MTPKISIIIPCYNQAQYLEACLQSVFSQTYSNWECIIVNDGSTDSTEKIAHSWTKKDNRFLYFFKENGGLSSARNLGLDKISGDYIQFLDSDDCLETTKLELSIKSILQEPSTAVVISNFKMFDDNLKKSIPPFCVLSQEKFTFENILYQWDVTFSIPIHCGFFEKSLFQNFRFPENLSSKEDWVMWVNLLINNPKTIFINQPLAFYRRNPNSMTNTKNFLTDILKAIAIHKTLISEEDFQKLYEGVITKYYNSAQDFKMNLINLKNSKTYKLEHKLKKIFQKLNRLNPFKIF